MECSSRVVIMSAAEIAILTIASYVGARVGDLIADFTGAPGPAWVMSAIGALVCWGAAFAALTTDIAITVKK